MPPKPPVPEDLGSWTQVGVDGFVLAPPPLPLGRLALGAVLLVGVWVGLGAYYVLVPDGPRRPSELTFAAWILFTLASAVLGARDAVSRTTLTVRGDTLRVERTWLGVYTTRQQVPLEDVEAQPIKQWRPSGDVQCAVALMIPGGSIEVALGRHAPARADALVDATVALLERAKREAAEVEARGTTSDDPAQRRAIDALRGRERP